MQRTLYNSKQYLDVMLFFENWFGSHTNSSEKIAEKWKLVEKVMASKYCGFSDIEKDTIATMLWAVADSTELEVNEDDRIEA